MENIHVAISLKAIKRDFETQTKFLTQFHQSSVATNFYTLIGLAGVLSGNSREEEGGGRGGRGPRSGMESQMNDLLWAISQKQQKQPTPSHKTTKEFVCFRVNRQFNNNGQQILLH